MLPSDQLEAIVERGNRAAALLANETFAWVIEDQTNYHLAALVAAPPGTRGVDAVTYHHAQQHAISELVATLQGHVSAAANVERALANSGEEFED